MMLSSAKFMPHNCISEFTESKKKQNSKIDLIVF